jgi:hypothetical protein
MVNKIITYNFSQSVRFYVAFYLIASFPSLAPLERHLLVLTLVKPTDGIGCATL